MPHCTYSHADTMEYAYSNEGELRVGVYVSALYGAESAILCESGPVHARRNKFSLV